MMNIKKIYKKTIYIVVLLILIMHLSIYAAGTGFDPNLVNSNTSVDYGLRTPIEKIWGTVLNILRIAAVMAIIISGVRYMFASADNRADIKRNLMYLVMGSILVFGTTFIVEFIVQAFEKTV